MGDKILHANKESNNLTRDFFYFYFFENQVYYQRRESILKMGIQIIVDLNNLVVIIKEETMHK